MVERPPIELAELPTIRQLAKASVTAFVVATLLLVVGVLPAEFAIDPTGLGRALGLMQLGELKKEQSTVIAEGQSTTRTDELKLTLSPGQSAEIKATMKAKDTLEYVWEADNGPLFFEFHGDPKGKPASEFVSYEKATKQASKGTFEAAFEGKHGWYWKNINAQIVTVTLRTRGVYQSVSVQ
jgi:hypothetical protein